MAPRPCHIKHHIYELCCCPAAAPWRILGHRGINRMANSTRVITLGFWSEIMDLILLSFCVFLLRLNWVQQSVFIAKNCLIPDIKHNANFCSVHISSFLLFWSWNKSILCSWLRNLMKLKYSSISCWCSISFIFFLVITSWHWSKELCVIKQLLLLPPHKHKAVFGVSLHNAREKNYCSPMLLGKISNSKTLIIFANRFI